MPAPTPDAEAPLVAMLVRSCGLPFCVDCLAHELALAPDVVKTAIQTLDPALIARGRRICVRCMRTLEKVLAIPRTNVD